MYYIGIDGGGTKTEFVIADESGKVLSTYLDETIHYGQIGFEKMLSRVQEGINKLLVNIDVKFEEVIGIGIGVPGYGEVEKDSLEIEKVLKQSFGNKIKINNDVAIANVGAFAYSSGIVLVAGTGSMAVTMKEDGSITRCGGWGADCGDEGSAYWIGCKALQVFGKMSDGRIEKSEFYTILKNELNLRYDFELIDYVEKSKDKRRTIASLSKYIGIAAECGDKEAQNILNLAAIELSLLVKTVLRCDKGRDSKAKVACIGGVFNAKDRIITPLREALQKDGEAIEIIAPILKPSLGACLYARGKEEGLNEFVSNLKAHEKIKEKYLIKNLVQNGKMIHDIMINACNGVVESLKENENEKDCIVIDGICTPGIIDMHTHGIMGLDVMDCEVMDLIELSKNYSKMGVTSFLATTVTCSMEKLEKVLKNIRAAIAYQRNNGYKGARILGAYVEGPFISVEKRGAHDETLISNVDIDEFDELIEKYKDVIKVIAIAPEKENAEYAAKKLNDSGIVTAIGHSIASYEKAKNLLDKYNCVGIHIFNGMANLLHREPGIIGALLESDRAYTELISDGIHLHRAIVNIVYKLKKDKMILITDSMSATLLKDGNYKLGTLDVVVKDSIPRLSNGSLAGSTLVLYKAIKNCMEFTGESFENVIELVTINPSKLLKEKEVGVIDVGSYCDITIFDDNHIPQGTIINGTLCK